MTVGEPEPLRVLYVLWEFPARSETFVRREMRALVRRGVVVEVLVLGPPPPRAAEAARACAEFGVVLRRPRASNPTLWARALVGALGAPRALARARRAARDTYAGAGERKVRRILRLLVLVALFLRVLRANPPALIHAHFAGVPAAFALLIGAALRRPFGISVHAHDLYANPERLAEKVAEARYVLACSDVARRDLAARVADPQRVKIHRVYHGLELERWRRVGSSASRGARPFVALAVGRFEPKKGFGVLLDACARLAAAGLNFRCELVGDGSERRKLAARIAELRLSDAVTIVPWSTPDLLRERFRAADALVVPSVIAADGDRDNIPNVVLEAFAMELPVIASALPALDEALAGGDAGLLFVPGDADALGEALQRLAGDERLAERLARSGRARAVACFDVERSAQFVHEHFAAAVRDWERG